MTSAGMMTKTASAIRSPASNNGDILTGSGLEKYIQTNVAFSLKTHDALLETANILRRGIIKGGRRWLFNIDGKIAARKVTKPLRAAAACHFEAARDLMLTLALYRQTFADAHIARSGAGEMDPTK